MEEYEIYKKQNQKIVKSNDLIQKCCFELSAQEQKLILFLISRIKPTDTDLLFCKLNIKDFCKIIGANADNGGNKEHTKQIIKNISDKSKWYRKEDEEILFRWIDTANLKGETVTIKLSESLKPFLIGLKEKYTSYELLSVLAMQSKYSIRVFELLKSYVNNQGGYARFTLDYFKEQTGTKYERWADIKRFVIEKSIEEIHCCSGMRIEYQTIKTGKKVTGVKFYIELLNNYDDLMTANYIVNERLKR